MGRLPDSNTDAAPTVQSEPDKVQGPDGGAEVRPSESEDPVDSAIARLAFRSNLRIRLRNEAMGLNDPKPFRVQDSSLSDIQEQIYQSVQVQLRILRMWNPEVKASSAMDSIWANEVRLSYILDSAKETNRDVGFAGMTFAEFLVHTGLREEFEKHMKFANKFISDAGIDEHR